ncbi:NUDIX domain-containing protein [Patescibacteria group bacterium]|nr:NUDIX domain-containing protein [Patescibacteria group bacterium]
MKINLTLLTNNYLNLFQDESDVLSLFIKQIEENQDILNRKNFKGHVTASGLIISADKKILVVFHNKLQKYLPPGGHIEVLDKSIIASAKREAIEETNLTKIKLHDWCLHNNSPILIDTHKIPKNKSTNENSHFHHDFMFIFNTLETDIFLNKNEASDYIWMDINNLTKGNSNISTALKKMIILNLI